jgi:NAD(P)-dependent dehydrogenase (short-subunit alcohol dehydrogenase family)
MLTESIILITGAGQGIGAATAKLAARQGYIVCINYHKNQVAAQRVMDEIVKEKGHAFLIQADISKPEQVSQLFEAIDTHKGRLTALVNNAGIIETQATFDKMTPQRFEKVFATNVLGTFYCTQEAIKRMSTANNGKGGSIVNVSSVAAKLGAPFEYIDYAATKGAIDTFTIGIAKEVAEQGIRINGVRPGIILTDIHAKAGEPNRVHRIKGNIPLKRGGTPEEVANAILWLLSDEASYITGTILDVSGGR